MHDQLVHLADMAERPSISIQVVPASVGAHAGLACAFLIGSAESDPDLLLVEAIEDQTIKDQEVVGKAAVAFRSCPGRRAAAYRLARPDTESS